MESDYYNVIFVNIPEYVILWTYFVICIAFDVLLTIHYKTQLDKFSKIWKNLLIDA